MLKLIEDKNELEAQLQGYFSLADPKEKSWRVRYTVPECLESIIDIIIKLSNFFYIILDKDKSILKN